MENIVEYKVYGRRALFTDPLSKMGGEKYSYPIPTYQSLVGITESIYWKPTFNWIIDRVRIVKPIRTEVQNVLTARYNESGRDLSIYSYLSDVEYQVQAHFEWNLNRDDLKGDRNENKHFFSAKRMIERGGRRDIFLGTRECQGYVEPCKFGEGTGHYDNTGSARFGTMFHGFDHPSETGVHEEVARFWSPDMNDGMIEFLKPEECTVRRKIKDATPQIVRMDLDECMEDL